MKAFGLLLLAIAAGCVATEPRSNLDEAEAAAARASCRFGAGTPAGLSLAADAPLGGELPIDTIVVVTMQGRSFDHVLGALPGADGAPDGAVNPDASGAPVARAPLARYCVADPPHDWNAHHVAYADGRNDGFVRASANPEVMGYYTSSALPGLYSLASRFAAADHHFSSLLGPPQANRAFLYAATSFGAVSGEAIAGDRPTLFRALEAAGVSWSVYSESTAPASMMAGDYAAYRDRFRGYSDFVNDAASGNLPHVTFVDPRLEGADGVRDDFDAVADVQFADSFLVHLAAALARSPQWPRAALFITFADDGGFYDHAAPPAACPPDDAAPALGDGDLPGGFDRLGFRVPLVVVSPWAKRGFVGHEVYDHTSILRLIEARFRLGALTARDANARPPLELFDFSRSDETPPALADAPLDGRAYGGCDPDDPE